MFGIWTRLTQRRIEMDERDLVRLVCTHHKCASRFQNNVFRTIWHQSNVPPKQCRFRWNAVYDEHVRSIDKPLKGVHVVRDPRDLLVSGYYSHRYTHNLSEADDLEFRGWLHAVPKEDGLLFEIIKGGYRPAQGLGGTSVLEGLAAWSYGDPRFLEVHMEDLVGDPATWIPRVLDHLEIEASRKVIRRALDANSFQKLSGGRRPGQEDQQSHYRKGTPGDWRNHFTDLHHRVFEQRWGFLLPLLGYDQE